MGGICQSTPPPPKLTPGTTPGNSQIKIEERKSITRKSVKMVNLDEMWVRNAIVGDQRHTY